MCDILTETSNSMKYKKWEDPDYKKQYFRNYYHRNKNLKNKDRIIDVENWTKDPQLRKEYFKRYKETKGSEPFECEVCKCMITMNNKSNHRKTKVHLNAVKLLSKQ